jgi:hypothetical protein
MNYCFWLLVLGSAAAAACEPIDSSAASDAGPLDGGTSAADSTLPLTSAPMSTPSAPTPTTTPMATATATPTSTATATATPTSTATATATSLPASTATATATATESSAPLPPNLITNGDFADGTAKWAIVSGTAKESIVAGYLCVAVAAANDTATIVLGWPEPAGSAGVPLSATGSYTFSYTAYATKASVTVAATVGDSVRRLREQDRCGQDHGYHVHPSVHASERCRPKRRSFVRVRVQRSAVGVLCERERRGRLRKRAILALQRRYPDMKGKDPLGNRIPLPISRRRDVPVFDFSPAALHPHMKLLRSL